MTIFLDIAILAQDSFALLGLCLNGQSMSEQAAERKCLVQTLRSCARVCGVRLVRDDVGREKVRGFAAAIEASTGAEGEKASAREAFAAYEATWAQQTAEAALSHAHN